MSSIRAIAISLFATALFVHAQAPETYKTRLSPIAATGQARVQVAGLGSATAVLAGTKLTVTGTFDGLKTNATTVKLHNGVATGARGPAIHDLTITKAMNGGISGALELNAQEVEALRKGHLYIQIYSEKPDTGTLWGWLIK